jgi:hypothetical protein
MVGLKEITLVNEAIKHLKYKISRYMKTNPYVHPCWICSTIYMLFLISLQNQTFTFNEFYGLIDL